MYKTLFLCCCLLAGVASVTDAQNNTNSPYSMYGYGEIATSGLAVNRAIGGTGYGLRSNKWINTVNPASFSATDSMTFMLDLGLSARISRFEEDGNKHNSTNGNLEYIAAQFPLAKKLGVSFGFIPFSFVGYNVTTKQTTPSVIGDITSTSTFVGTGGITQLYGGIAYQIGNRLAVGLDANYAFGYIKHNSKLAAGNYSTTRIKNLQVNDLRLHYGAQFEALKTDRHSLTIGATYQPQTKLDGEFSVTTTSSATDTETTATYSFDLPTIAGGGLYYSYRNTLSAGLDYTREQWADCRFYDLKDSLINVNRFAAGVAYTPSPNSKTYYKRIRYSVGGSFANSYTLKEANNYSLAVGFGFPLRYSKTYLNTVFEYGCNNRSSSLALKEDYFKFTLSASISELWFFKRRLE